MFGASEIAHLDSVLLFHVLNHLWLGPYLTEGNSDAVVSFTLSLSLSLEKKNKRNKPGGVKSCIKAHEQKRNKQHIFQHLWEYEDLLQ